MPTAYFLDTNIFLRVLIRENEKMSDECELLLERIKENSVEAFTSHLNIAEVVWTLDSFYKYSREKIADALESIANLNNLNLIDDFNLSLAISLYREKNVKLIDCLIASLEEIQAGKWSVVSYDKDFDKLKVLRKEPKNILKQFRLTN